MFSFTSFDCSHSCNLINITNALSFGSMFLSLRFLFPITFSQSLRKRRKNLLAIGGIGLTLHIINDITSNVPECHDRLLYNLYFISSSQDIIRSSPSSDILLSILALEIMVLRLYCPILTSSSRS